MVKEGTKGQCTELYLYRYMNDAWNEIIRDEVLEMSKNVWDGHEKIVLVPNHSIAQWIKQKCLSDGIYLLGVQFLTASLFRQMLFQRVFHQLPTTLDQESAQFLLRYSIQKDAEKFQEAKAAELNPSQILEAADRLYRNGIKPDHPRIKENYSSWFQKTYQTITEFPHWIPKMDEDLLLSLTKHTPDFKMDILILGWDAPFIQEAKLLLAGRMISRYFKLFVPSIWDFGRDRDADWVKWLEATFDITHQPCGYNPEKNKPYEALVEKFFLRSDSKSLSQEPELKAGTSQTHQVRLAVEQLKQWGVENKEARIALVVPQRSALSIAIAQELNRWGISFQDETGQHQALDLNQKILESLLNFYSSGESVWDFEKLLEYCLAKSNPENIFLQDLQGFLSYSYKECLSLKIRELVKHIDQESQATQAIHSLLKQIPEWPKEDIWENHVALWNGILTQWQIEDIRFIERFAGLESLFSGKKMTREFFWTYLRSILGRKSLERHQSGKTHFAKVFLTNLSKAIYQEWTHLILFDMNEGKWFGLDDSNPYLSEKRCQSLNQGKDETRLPILTALDRRIIEERRLLDLIGSISEKCLLIAQVFNEAKRSEELYPNIWFNWCMQQSERSEWKGLQLHERWNKLKQQACEHEQSFSSSLIKNETTDVLEHFNRIHNERSNPDKPFNDYFFNFGMNQQDQLALTGNDFNKIAQDTSSLAYKYVFHAEDPEQFLYSQNRNRLAQDTALYYLKQALKDVSLREKGLNIQSVKEELKKKSDHLHKNWEKNKIDGSQDVLRQVEYYWEEFNRGLEKFNGSTELQFKAELKGSHGSQSFSDKPDLIMNDPNGKKVAVHFDWSSEAGFSASAVMGSMKYVVDDLSLKEMSSEGHYSVKISPEEEPREMDLDKNRDVIDRILTKVSALQEQRVFGMGVPSGITSKQDKTSVPLATTHYPEQVLQKKWEATFNE